EKLHQLTRYHQVFCVTHIPRIATFADWHYQVFKSKGGGGVRTGIELLSGDERVDEICRMLGDTTGRKVTREHARDILDRAQNR
ncbi:MAG: DNA repair protein RecN, partial [Actinobacteria bacterium]|nr:DNA repair protein RecN [Actinomycetota bacterium]